MAKLYITIFEGMKINIKKELRDWGIIALVFGILYVTGGLTDVAAFRSGRVFRAHDHPRAGAGARTARLRRDGKSGLKPVANGVQ